LEGSGERIEAFLKTLPSLAPAAARVEQVIRIAEESLASGRIRPFTITESGTDAETDVLIPADRAMCADCRQEIFDPSGRRYGYPFTTCTRCGPRYTVLHGMPYDRQRTTMEAFPLCADCRREYENSEDRRFHAESMACPVCGPRLILEDARGAVVSGDPIRQVRSALAAGAIVAVRGMGGFLLAADARNEATLRELRRRKNRPHKPFAVQARNLDVVRQVCARNEQAAASLESDVAPIVILDAHDASLESDALPMTMLSPDTRTLGVMLPPTPLQALLAEPLPGDPVPAFDWLVMTSGNRGGEPICISNDEARQRLKGIADFFLLHNREINLRCDDSLVAIQQDAPQVWRRARGFAPNPIRLSHRLERTVLAMGAELKNTLAMGYGDRIIASPHIGDLEAPEAVDGLRQVAEALPRFVGRVAEVIAVDHHPDMHATRIGREMARRLNIPVVEVQHHHAHAAAGLCEHGRRTGLALVFDGTGLGPDGHIWGAELLHVREDEFRRLASFEGVPLPGGDAAVRHPVRQLAGRCVAAGMDLPDSWRARLGISSEAWKIWTQQARDGFNSPITHAAGRLFDAYAAVLGLAAQTTTYEGQTAIRLEAAACECPADAVLPSIPFRRIERDGLLWINWDDAFRSLLEETSVDAQAAPRWARAFHAAIASAAVEMIKYGAAQSGCDDVLLSGGVFMNRILTDLLAARLKSAGLGVLLHRETPPNDGCIAIGQAVIAGSRASV